MQVNRGYVSEWERLFTANRQLKLEVLRLLEEYGIRTSGTNEQKAKSYRLRLDSWSVEEKRSFYQELDEIKAKHELPKWIARQIVNAVLMDSHILGDQDGGVALHGRKTPNSFDKWITIGPDVDLNDPYDRMLIEHHQRQILLHYDPPPGPITDKDDARRFDWTPVWEWKQKYPKVTHQELAEFIGYSHQYVRKKLSEVAREKSQQNSAIL